MKAVMSVVESEEKNMDENIAMCNAFVYRHL